ncbi:hypothetical protein G3I40_33605 [Streptomyces sp. SID14478]|uniref:hypothetical protein n=1 Tax=Streptomyces sp. SID14478 TaxID=2706073 RepID=UPI0013DEFDAA|nr:hypothetical protein [Streptomyces sp. SID14478]NEB80108.1 hypothetical protein [Streptomyces sp. SID14478]
MGGRPDDEPELPDELRSLGRLMEGPDGAGETMAERVLAQILAEHVPTPVAEPAWAPRLLRRIRRWVRLRWRVITAALCGVATFVVFTPPVRAAVADWFGFSGVEVRYDPSATPSAAQVPDCEASLPWDQAVRRAGFRPMVPAELGSPDAITVTREPGDRALLTLCWRNDGRTIRLDEYPAFLDMGYVKTAPIRPEWVTVGGDSGLWFTREHRLSFWMFDKHGDRWHRSERTAGPTLLWTHGTSLTLRLEGVASPSRALKIAESVRDPR